MSGVRDNAYLVKAYLQAPYGILVNNCQNNCNETFRRFSSEKVFLNIKKHKNVIQM